MRAALPSSVTDPSLVRRDRISLRDAVAAMAAMPASFLHDP
jgi:hypothetical protein